MTALADLVDLVLADELPPIVTAGHPVLRSPAELFDGQLDDATLRRLIETMRRVMHEAPGVGLAAPQIGIPLRIAVLEDAGSPDPEAAVVRSRSPLPFTAVINPAYRPEDGSLEVFYEGCLSVPGYQAVVGRYRSVALTYTRPDGMVVDDVLEGWAARIVQHETDHLDGVLYLDRAEVRSLSSDREHHRWSQPTVTDARRSLGF